MGFYQRMQAELDRLEGVVMEKKTFTIVVEVPKEAAEVIVALNKVSEVIAKELKDGFQPTTDVPNIGMKLALSAEYRDALTAAADKIQEVPAELRAAGIEGGIGLGMLAGDLALKTFKALA